MTICECWYIFSASYSNAASLLANPLWYALTCIVIYYDFCQHNHLREDTATVLVRRPQVLYLCFWWSLNYSLSYCLQAPCRKLLNSVLRGLELTIFQSDRDIYIPNCDTRGFYRKKQVECCGHLEEMEGYRVFIKINITDELCRLPDHTCASVRAASHCSFCRDLSMNTVLRITDSSLS